MQAVTSRTIKATSDEVWSVLANGWMYSGWVVGAATVRDVDPDFPNRDSNLHHSVGLWPIVLNDVTTVSESAPGELLVLRVRTRPFGEGVVRLSLHPGEDGTRVSMAERAIKGPMKYLPESVQAAVFTKRNDECLRRLAHLAELGAARDGSS